MPDLTLDLGQILQAVDHYLALAYPTRAPERALTQRQALASWGGPALTCPAFNRDPKSPASYTLRLGNCFYPHMKLAVQLAPRSERFLFRVDTHDRHVCPAKTSPEYAAFVELMAKNQQLANTIEADWDRTGVPTFKAYLREDLERRRAALSAK